MKRLVTPKVPLFALLTLLWAAAASGADWIDAPSYYSHDHATGSRVQQFAPVKPVFSAGRGDFRRSGYRQTRSSIQAGGSADHMHVVEEWGNPVRPYGEWRFPYRPDSVPYDAWGPPFGFGFAPFGGFPAGRFGPAFFGGFGRGPYAGSPPTPGMPPGEMPSRPAAPVAQPYPGYFPQPWHDGRYPPYDSNGPYGYPDLLQRPPAPAPVEGEAGPAGR